MKKTVYKDYILIVVLVKHRAFNQHNRLYIMNKRDFYAYFTGGR